MTTAPGVTLAVPVSDDDHVRGPADAVVTVVEHGDYECPYCAAARPVLAALLADGHVRLVFRNVPLADVHPYALTAALGLPPGSVVGDAAQQYGDKVEADFRSGLDSGVRGTPTLFLAGRPYTGPVEPAALRSAVRRAAAHS